jgi:ABC-2 type transport system ATP-binding protein
MIEIKNLTKKYRGKTAIDKISFNAKDGRITGFVGENGAGKSTTLNILMNIVHQNSGAALIDGKQYRQYKVPPHKAGCVLDYKVGLPNLRAIDFLKSVAMVYKIKKSKIRQVLREAGIEEAAKKPIRAFSLGMNQRLTIALALMFDPEMLILDEPFNGIDPKGIIWLKELFLRYKQQGKSVLLSSHQLSDVAQICDEVVLISHGKIVAQGTVESIIGKSNTRSVIVESPDIQILAKLLTAATTPFGASDATASSDLVGIDVQIKALGENRIEVGGLSQQQIGDIAFDNHIRLYELSMPQNAFDSAYLNLTSGQRGGTGGSSDYTGGGSNTSGYTDGNNANASGYTNGTDTAFSASTNSASSTKEDR